LGLYMKEDVSNKEKGEINENEKIL